MKIITLHAAAMAAFAALSISTCYAGTGVYRTAITLRNGTQEDIVR